MQPFRFVHAADLHIDSPFAGIGETDKHVAERLRESTFQAFQNLVELCIKNDAKFLVIAGDVYDGADRSVRAQLRFRDGLSKLAENGIQSFIVHGNHDPLDGWQSSIEWPEGVHIFGNSPEWMNVEFDGELLASVQGMSYPTQEVTDNLAIQFSAPQSDVFSIGLLHANVGGNTAHAPYAPCTVEELSQTGIDYWALGHVHTRQTLKRSNPVIAYPGNTQGRHPNETGARGALVVNVDGSGQATTEFASLDVVRWERDELDISNLESLDQLDSAVRQHTDNLSVQAEGRDVVCRINLVGRGPLHEQLQREGEIDDLIERARTAWSGSESPWVWTDKIINSTRPSMDVEDRAKQDDFLGAALSRTIGYKSDKSELEKLEKVVAEVFSGRRNSLPTANSEQLSDWTEEATWYLAELLENGR